MKKTILIILTALLLITSGSVIAQDEVDLTALAMYAPSNTTVYAAMRVDDGVIADLDALIAPVVAKIPLDEDEQVNMSYLINQAMFPREWDWNNNEWIEPEYTFEDDVRPWLGDSIAVFAVLEDIAALQGSGPGSYPLGIVIDITNQDGAVEFFRVQMADAIEYDEITVIEQDDGSVLFESQYDYPPQVLVTDETVFISFGPFMFTDATLVGNDVFTGLLGELPADGYNAIAYMDLVPLAQNVQAMIAEMGEAPPELINAFDVTALGQQALGFTILDGRTLAADAVTNSTLFPAGGTLDLSFLEHVPQGTALLMQQTGMADKVNYMFDMLAKADSLLEQAGALPLPPEAGPFQFMKPSNIGTFITLAFEGTTGLDFDETLAWMNGDAVHFVSLPVGEAAPSLYGYSLGFGVEMGTVMATSDAAASAELVGVVAEMASDMWATATFEDCVVRASLGDIISQPQLGAMAFGSNDSVVAMGDGGSVDFALNPSGDNITTAPNFVYEQAFFVENPSALFFFDMAPVHNAVAAFMAANPDAIDEYNAGMVEVLLGMIQSGAITISHGDDVTVARATLTLGE